VIGIEPIESDEIPSKFAPVIVTLVVPASPLDGENEPIVGCDPGGGGGGGAGCDPP
jgi:hypothetical protein